ncbi:MAG: ATP-binding cassette domain-containing protein [Actinomycetota bacterium]
MSVSNPSLLRAERLVAGRGSFRTAPLDLDVRPGDVVAIVGPSGSGKTSILRTLAGVAEPWSGSVVGSSRCAVCFQEPRLLPWRTVIENVLFGLGRRPHDADRARAISELERLDIGELADRHVADLSGGQRRRVAIARTLAASRAVALVDEPFTQLDVGAATLVESALTDHAASGGGVVVAVHDADGLDRLVTATRSVDPSGPSAAR